MRTLKKSLALVLVIALVLSIGAVGASAAFTDTASSNYGTAIAVMSGIGVIDGMTDTTFVPAGTLTREQAAKIIAFMLLGPTNAGLISSASAQKFDDVTADRWSAGYIEYCANLGIISGVGDNNFDPTGTLSTAAWTKMLLCALGYKATAEGLEGDSWAINTAALAMSAGVYDSGIVISAATSATREQACQLAYKTLTAKTVKYTGGSSIVVNGVELTTGATLNYVANADTVGYLYDSTGNTPTGNDLFMQFCESHFSTLKKTAAVADSFGRPSVSSWLKGTTKLAQVATAATETYTTSVTAGKIYSDLGLSSTISATTYTDGSFHNGTLSIAAGSTTPIGGNGALTEVYYNSTAGTITIVVTNTYVGTITTVTPATASAKASVVVTAGAVKLSTFATGTYETTGFTVNDVVLYTVAETASGVFAVKSVKAATSQILTPTSYTSTTFTAGGTTYKYSAQVIDKVASFADTTVYFDDYGYVIDTDSVAANNYAYVVDLGSTSDGFTTVYQAKLLLADGTVEVVKTDKDYTQGASTPLAASLEGEAVRYVTSTSTGKTTLTPAAASTKIASTTLSLKTGVASFTWNGVNTNVANSKTVFLVATTSGSTTTYHAYTGIANVPSLEGTVAGAIYSTGGIANVVFIDNPTVTGVSTTERIFITGIYDEVVTPTGSYYVTEAVVNGEIKTLNMASDSATIGVYTTMTTNADGYVSVSVANGGTFSAKPITAPANGVISINSVYYGYTDDVAVYTYNTTTGAITASSIAAVAASASATGAYAVNTNGAITSLYIAG